MANNNLSLAIIEKQILHLWMDNPSLMFEDDIWVSENAKEFSFILLSLRDDNKSCITEHILTQSIEYVDINAINSVIDTEYQLDKYNDYKDSLIRKYIINKFKNDIIYDLNKESSTDDEIILSIEDEFNKIKSLMSKKSTGLSFSTLVNQHKEIIKKRAKGIKVNTGCSKLDKLIPNPTAGIITIVGYSGSCKSTLIQYWVKQRIVKRLPTILINTELSREGLMDSLTASMIEVNYEDVQGINNDDEHIDYDLILDRYNEIEDVYKNNNTFKLYPNSNASVNDITNFVKQCKKEFNLPNKDLPIFVFIDLMSMLKDFCEGGTSRADAITQAINRLNEVALQENLIIVGTVQLKRMPNKITIEKEEDIERFRPTMDSIKDSGSYEERSRCVISIFNPYNIVRKNPCDPIIRDITEPLIELTTLKNTYNNVVGESVKYYMNSEYKVFVPYEEEEENNIEIEN